MSHSLTWQATALLSRVECRPGGFRPERPSSFPPAPAGGRLPQREPPFRCPAVGRPVRSPAERSGSLVPVTMVVGAQWGDEGKGKVTDLLAPEVDFVVRYQGGDNAGHTIVVGEQVYKLS